MTDRKPRSEYTGSCAKLPYEMKVPNIPPAVEVDLVHQFRKIGACNWYDGRADHDDGDGPYEERTLYTHAPDSAARVAELEAELSAWKQVTPTEQDALNLADQVIQLKADAERYRWLEVNAYQGISPLRSVLWCIRGLFGKDNESFAAAIDAAMGVK